MQCGELGIMRRNQICKSRRVGSSGFFAAEGSFHFFLYSQFIENPPAPLKVRFS